MDVEPSEHCDLFANVDLTHGERVSSKKLDIMDNYGIYDDVELTHDA